MSNNPQTLCRTCVTPIGYVDCPTGGWWAHETHPADEHDAVPGAWVDGDELMEAIAAEVWEHCAGEGTSLVVDDPRNIAGTAAAVARRMQPAEMDQLRRERDLAIAHDRQPYPTAWAYEQACKAREKHRERADAAEAKIGAMRADVLREVADICDEAASAHAERGADDPDSGANTAASALFALMERFQRKADEAEYVATPCDPMNPCEEGGEPCHIHERLMAHSEGEHELCEPDCGVKPAVLPAEVTR